MRGEQDDGAQHAAMRRKRAEDAGSSRRARVKRGCLRAFSGSRNKSTAFAGCAVACPLALLVGWRRRWCRSVREGGLGPGWRRFALPRRRCRAMTASSAATCCAHSISTSRARPSGPTIPMACARRASCASASARSAARRPRGRSRRRRSRPRCTPLSAARIQSAASGGRTRVQITVLGKSPAWQDADGACSGYLVEEGDTRVLLDCGNGVFSKLRRYRDYIDGRRGRRLAPARRPLPRPRPVRLRADVLAAPAGRADRRLAGHERPRPPRPVRAGRRARDLPPRHRRVGQRGPRRDRLRPARVRPRRDARRRHDCACASSEVPHYTTTYAVGIASADGGGRFTYGADTAPNDELVRFADGSDLLMLEATLPEPEPDTPARAPHAHRGGRARRARPRAAPGHHAHDRRAGRVARPRRRRAGLRRARRSSPTRAPSTTSERPAGRNGAVGMVKACLTSATSSPTSSACAARWTSSSATSSTAPAWLRAGAGASHPPWTSSTRATRRARSCTPSSRGSTPTS